MTPDAFEQLVSAWLTEPDRADLRQQVETAAAADPTLAGLLAEWRRCDALLREPSRELEQVNWAALQARIGAALDAAETDAAGEAPDERALDEVLRRLPSADQQVNWPRLRARIMARVSATEPHAAPRRRLYTRLAPVAALLAAAAALFFAVLKPESAGPVARPAGLAQATVSALPGGAGGAPGVGAVAVAGIASVHIAVAEATIEPPPRFFMMAPVVTQASAEDSAGYY